MFGEIDVSFAEQTAALALLREHQEAQRQWLVENKPDEYIAFLSNEAIGPETKFLNTSDPDDCLLLNDLMYYLEYAMSVFGWPASMIDDPCFLCCCCPYLSLIPSCCKFRCCDKSSSRSRRTKVFDGQAGVRLSNVKETSTSPEIEHQNNGDNNNNKESKSNLVDIKNKQELNSQSNILASVSSEQNSHVSPTKNYESIQKNTKDKSIQRDNISNSIYKNKETEIIKNAIRPAKNKNDLMFVNKQTTTIIEDNCCNCNVAAFKRRFRAHNCQIIYATYHVDVAMVPFLVAADHSKRSIVVTTRGSLSIYDAITDFYGQPDSFPLDGCPSDWLCHRGIAKAAQYVKTILETQGILEEAFKSRPDLQSETYDLILCGHSLGAGVAAILGILLRQQYPNLKVYLYSAPGGLLSLPVVEYTKQFSTTVFLGNDVVQRLGIAQYERLRYCALHCLKNSNLQRGQLMSKFLCPSFCKKKSQVEYNPETSFDYLNCTNCETFLLKGVKVPFQPQPQILYVPGKLIHIVKNYSDTLRPRGMFSKQPLYQAVWTDNEKFDRIIMADNMVHDHLPNNLMHGLKMLFKNTISTARPSRSSIPSAIINAAFSESSVTGAENSTSKHRTINTENKTDDITITCQ